MAHHPKWFFLDETPEMRRKRHETLKKILVEREYFRQVEEEKKILAAEQAEDAKDRRSRKGRHRKK